MEIDPLLETTVESHLIHEGSYLRLRRDTVQDGRGRRHNRDIVEHPGAVAILAVTGDDLLLVRQFRTAAARVLLEIPAGTLDRRSDGRIESPDVAAPRELAEETGHRAEHWRRLGSFWTVPGFATEEMHLYLATGLSPVPGYAGPQADEPLTLERLPWRELLAMGDRGEVADAKTLVGVFWLARLAERGERFS